MVVEIYTDGGCRDNQNKDKSKVIGAWAYILSCNGKTKELYGAQRNTTNNEMELTAILMALQAMKRKDVPIKIHPDSQYAINCLTTWLPNWKRNGWRSSKGKTIANKKLIQSISNLMDTFASIKFEWVKGHDADVMNNRVDALVNKAMDTFM